MGARVGSNRCIDNALLSFCVTGQINGNCCKKIEFVINRHGVTAVLIEDQYQKSFKLQNLTIKVSKAEKQALTELVKLINQNQSNKPSTKIRIALDNKTVLLNCLRMEVQSSPRQGQYPNVYITGEKTISIGTADSGSSTILYTYPGIEKIRQIEVPAKAYSCAMLFSESIQVNES